MFRNYIKIAWRNIWRNKEYSALNIGGLAIGMSAGFLMILYVGFEMSYDRFHSKSNQLYRVVTDIEIPSRSFKNSVVDWNILGELKSEFREIEAYSRLLKRDIDVQVNGENYIETKSIAVDSQFFELFDFKFKKGNKATALAAPLSVVLNESTAQKYFGDVDALGQTFKIFDGKHLVKVTGVIEDTPANTQVGGNIILSISTYTDIIDTSLKESWADFETFGYVLLNKQTNVELLEAKVEAYNQHAHGAEMEEAKLSLTYHFEPLKDVYLYSDRSGPAKIKEVYIFSIIALLILIIAAVNFINLTTARSLERAKEVGVRKVIGAQKKQLVFQFLSESVLICLSAVIFSAILTQLALPYLNELSGKLVSTNIFKKPQYLLGLFGTAICIALLAGVYPALILSSFKPSGVLKGKFSKSSKGSLLRKTLVIIQFSISVVLIIGTIIIYKQNQFMRDQDLGFTKKQLVILETGSERNQELLKRALQGNPNVLSMSAGSGVPGGGGIMEGILSVIENSAGEKQTLALKRYHVDKNYIPQLGFKLIAGRNFSQAFASDSTEAIILNEKAVKSLGFVKPVDVIGKTFDQSDKKGRVIGVVKDFNFNSLQKEIRPLSIVMGSSHNKLLNLELRTNDLNSTMSSIESYWKKYIPNKPFNYHFLDDYFERQYRSERLFGKLFLNFSLLAILISCLGLFGLTSYSILQRRSEIGVRKILGASVFGIVKLLSIELLRLIVISIVIAWPIAWYFMSQWLQDFAYRISMDWTVFAAAGILAISIALITVSFQAIKAAIANPIKSLRTE